MKDGILSSVTVSGPLDSEVMVEFAKLDMATIFLTIRQHAGMFRDTDVTLATVLNRGSAMALAKVLEGWAQELPL